MNREQAIDKAKKWMLRKCGSGTECACEKVKKVFAAEKLSIQAGSVTFFGAEDTDEEHPNKMPFKGVLLIVDAPSTKPPHGSRGHRIYVPKSVVEDKLDGLIGMGVNYDPEDLNEHKTQNKVGIITKAWTKGNQVWVSGFIYKKDFPRAADDLKRSGLGMSMELANVYVRDENEDVWHLEDFAFTGATILKKSAAAYFQTELVAKGEKPATAGAVSGNRKGDGMEKQQKKEKVVAAASDTGQGALLVSAIKGAISEAMTPMVQELKASNDRNNELRNDLEELKGLYMIQAAAQEEDDEDGIEAAHEEDDEEAAASKKSDDEDSEDNADDEGEEDDLDANLENLEELAPKEDVGELNKDAKNKGDKTTVTDPPTQGIKVGGGVAEGRLKSAAMKAGKPFPGLKSASIQAAAVEIATLTAQVSQLKKYNRRAIDQLNAQAREYKKDRQKLVGKVNALEAQAEKWANGITRRTVVPVEIRNLAAKSSVDLNELQREGRKLSVADVDRMFAVAAEQGIQVDTTMRAGYKTRMYELGLMESGQQEWGQQN